MRPSLQLRVFFVGLLSVFLLLPTLRAAQAQDVASKKATIAPSKVRVAVLYFDYSGSDEELGFLRKGLTQMLVTDLSERGDLTLVERTDLEAVLAELELGKSKKIDRASATKIGKLLGAQYLVTGGYFSFKNRMRVDAKIIDVETGVTKGIGVSRDQDNFLDLETELARKLGAALVKAKVTQVGQSSATKTASTKRPANAKKVTARTVARYGRALDAIDHGNKKIAMKELTAITSDAPDFKPAAEDLKVLLR